MCSYILAHEELLMIYTALEWKCLETPDLGEKVFTICTINYTQ